LDNYRSSTTIGLKPAPKELVPFAHPVIKPDNKIIMVIMVQKSTAEVSWRKK
jgi:hypothetical protein